MVYGMWWILYDNAITNLEQRFMNEEMLLLFELAVDKRIFFLASFQRRLTTVDFRQPHLPNNPS